MEIAVQQNHQVETAVLKVQIAMMQLLIVDMDLILIAWIIFQYLMEIGANTIIA